MEQYFIIFLFFLPSILLNKLILADFLMFSTSPLWYWKAIIPKGPAVFTLEWIAVLWIYNVIPQKDTHLSNATVHYCVNPSDMLESSCMEIWELRQRVCACVVHAFYTHKHTNTYMLMHVDMHMVQHRRVYVCICVLAFVCVCVYMYMRWYM